MALALVSRPQIQPDAIARGEASPEPLFQALAAALSGAPEPHADAKSSALLLAELERSGSENMADMSRVLEQRLAVKGFGLPPEFKVRISLALSLYNHVLQQLDLDPLMHDQVASSRTGFVIGCLLDESIWVDSNHPLRWLLDSYSQEAVTWYPELGKQGQKLFEHYRQLANQLLDVATTDNASAALEEAIAPLKRLVAIEARRSETLRKRYVDSEQAEAKVSRAQRQVNEMLNRELADRLLPDDVAAAVLKTLRQELQFCLINSSDQDVFWRRWTSVLPFIARVFQTPHESYGREQLFADAHKATGLLEFEHRANTCTQQDYEEFIGLLQSYLFALLKDQRPETLPFASQQLEGDIVGVTTQISRQVMARLNSFVEGDWFMLVDDADAVIRCALAAKMPESGLWLFANRSGHKVADKAPDAFALCLSSKLAKPLTRECIFESAYASALSAMNRRLGEYDGKLAAQRQRHAVEQQARQAAAEKAREEAAAIAQAQVQVEEQARLAQVQKVKEAAEADHLALVKQVETMAIGTWLVLKNHDKSTAEEPVRAKLAVSMQSTGKYIFVDRLGTKVATLMKPELIAGLDGGGIELLKDGESFENQLSRVVMGLRK